MASKRGRPLSGESDSGSINQQREQARKRMQRLRLDRKVQNVALTEPTCEQLQQGEYIVNLSSIQEESAPQTLLQVGLRVQNVTLAQNVGDAQLQREAEAVEERDAIYQSTTLYNDNRSTGQKGPMKGFFRQFANPKGDTIRQHENSQQSQRGIPGFFRSLPPSNPFTPRDSQPPILTQNRHHTAIVDDSNTDVLAIAEEDVGFQADPTTNQEPAETELSPLRGSEDQLAEIQSDDEEEIARSHSDEGESFHDFVSEHSVQSNEHEEHRDISNLEYMVDKLYDQLVVQFHGCSEEQHAEKLRDHMETANNNHHDLSEVFNDEAFPSVLGLSEMITPERLARQELPSSSQWSNMFCGVSRRRRTPMNVCIHKEQTQAVASDVAYDIDSFIGFATSPALAKKGLWVQPVSQIRQNMTADVHVNAQVFHTGEDPDQPARSTSAMLRDIPHFLFGRVVGAHDITIHVLFPHMVTVHEKFVCLTKEQMTRWLDRIFLPALHQHYDPHYTQHIPGNFRHAFANSKAHQVEGRQVETASYQAQQSVGYHLQPQNLEAMWTTMQNTIANTPGLADFREPQLFFGAKGTKLQFKTSPSGQRKSLLDAMDHFESFFDDIFDPSFVQLERFYVDIGKEICPHVSLLAEQQAGVGEEAQVYLHRRCCLQEYIRWMYDGRPPKSGHGQQYFCTNMLYEASSLTSVTPKRSKQRDGGLIYSQLYASVKEISDATKCFPFNNDGMEEMALDPQIRKGARRAAGGRWRDAKVIEQAYLASKCRTRDALTASRKKSFGVREEHRIEWRLLKGLQAYLRDRNGAAAEVELTDCPSHVWPVKTSVYLDYLWRSADKFATGFEVIRARCRSDFVTWEQTKMMAMFLRCLRFIFGGHLLSRESALWWSRRERGLGEQGHLRVWYGLGFCNTLSRYGYCWLEPRVDWNLLQFQSEVTDHVLFGNSVLRGQYLRRGGHVQAFFDTTRRMELALNWMEKHPQVDEIWDRMISWIVHICLQQFRVDVLSCVSSEIMEDQREEAIQATTPFCFEWLDKTMAGRLHLMSGNRCNFKVVTYLGDFLFDFDDGRTRSHWEDRPFRKLYRRALAATELHGRRTQRRFAEEFKRTLYQYHWVLPYPCENALMQTTKQGRRMWYSIQTREGVEVREAESKDWGWARKGWQVGRPRPFPRWLEWSREEWQRWVEVRAA